MRNSGVHHSHAQLAQLTDLKHGIPPDSVNAQRGLEYVFAPCVEAFDVGHMHHLEYDPITAVTEIFLLHQLVGR